MKFTLSSVTISALVLTFVRGILARQNPRQVCGTDGEVLSNSTITHEGKAIQVVTKTCPSLVNVTAPTVQKRQSVCTDGGCTVVCEDYGEQPFVSDCQVITNFLEAQYPNEFLAPAGTYAEWSYSSCAYAFINFDAVSYNVCYSEFGFNSIIAADDCFGDWPAPSATSGAACVSPGYAGDDWELQVFFP